MVGDNSLVPHYWWRWNKAYLNSRLLSMHLQECEEEGKGKKYTCSLTRLTLQTRDFLLPFIFATSLCQIRV
jgi:hypothetical protein